MADENPKEEAQPHEGGSYRREKDGSLTRVEEEKPKTPAPAKSKEK